MIQGSVLRLNVFLTVLLSCFIYLQAHTQGRHMPVSISHDVSTAEKLHSPTWRLGTMSFPPCTQRLSGPSVQPPLHLSSGPSSWFCCASLVGMLVPRVTSHSSCPHLECSEAPMRPPGPILQGTTPSEPDKTALEIPQCLPEGERSVLERKRYFLSLILKHH